MRHPGGDVGVADLLRVWRTLGGDDYARQRMAQMMGFTLSSDESPPMVEAASNPTPPAPPPPTVPGIPERGPTPRPKSRSHRRELVPVRQEVPSPLGAAVPMQLETVPSPDPDRPKNIPTHPPLFDGHVAPSLLAALVAVEVNQTEVDMDRAVRLLAERQSMSSLPVRRRRTLVRGVQLLTDIGLGMAPFRRDIEQLVALTTATIGSSATQRLQFADTPLRGAGPGARRTWTRSYLPPALGTPVLIATDLGIGGPSDHYAASRPEDWLVLSAMLARRGSPLVVLVPYPRPRWPRPLVGRVPIVTWDRSTTLVHARDSTSSRPSRWPTTR